MIAARMNDGRIELRKRLVNGQAEMTEAQHNIGTLYSADGQVLGHQQVVGGFHITFAAGGQLRHVRQPLPLQVPIDEPAEAAGPPRTGRLRD
jgi:hypothetical protein